MKTRNIIISLLALAVSLLLFFVSGCDLSSLFAFPEEIETPDKLYIISQGDPIPYLTTQADSISIIDGQTLRVYTGSDTHDIKMTDNTFKTGRKTIYVAITEETITLRMANEPDLIFSSVF